MTFIKRFTSKSINSYEENNINLKNNKENISSKIINETVENINDKIKTNHIKTLDEKNQNKIYEDFIIRFLKYVPTDYKIINNTNLFKIISKQAFNFIQLRKNNNPKIDFFEEVMSKTGISQTVTNLLINTENKRFIIDSLNGLFQRLNLDIMFLFHPVFSLTRDENGLVTKLSPNRSPLQSEIDNNNGVFTEECLFFISFKGKINDKEKNIIHQEISEIIDLTHKTNISWHDMLLSYQNTCQNITNNTDKILSSNKQINKNDLTEDIKFLEWLSSDHFTFLTLVSFNIKDTNYQINGVEEIITKDNTVQEEIKKIISLSLSELYQSEILILGKIDKISKIHLNSLIDYVLIKNIDEDGNYNSGTIVLGLYGKNIYYQSLDTIPKIRNKLTYVLKKSSFTPDGYNAKKLESIIHAIPREILIQIIDEDLYFLSLDILSTTLSGDLKFSLFEENTNNFINIFVFLKRENLTPENQQNIIKYLTNIFGQIILHNNINVVAHNFAYIFIIIKPDNSFNIKTIDTNLITNDLRKITSNWQENLNYYLQEKYDYSYANLMFHKWCEVFSSEYKHRYQVREAINDITYLEKALKYKSKEFSVIQDEKEKDTLYLKIYSLEKEVNLSDTLPMVENIGFYALTQQTIKLNNNKLFNNGWIYIFKVKPKISSNISFDNLKNNIEKTLHYLESKLLTNDILNSLALSGIHPREIQLLRGFASYLNQSSVYSIDYISSILVKHVIFSNLIIALFKCKFQPNININIINSVNDKLKLLCKDNNNLIHNHQTNHKDQNSKNNIKITNIIINRSNCSLAKKDRDLLFNLIININKYNTRIFNKITLPKPTINNI
ncbi:MAG TPA: NAD-glutamate dehydrogenase [Candidatus Megaira endosymbiont of Hartmannula sinica]|nr:NAD-glutamate dehydrogenase [Candidatus Megaera endosymbiont of Hartmannula sinica]